MNGHILILVILLIVGMPLLGLQGPILLQALPRPVLKLLCFSPCFFVCYLAFKAFGGHNFGSLLLTLCALPICLFSGLTLKSLLD